ncbi:hypothetical protein H0H81_004150, partial [Sphagnurus paluster]
MVNLIAQNRISGVSRIISTALHDGASAEAICRKLDDAIEGCYAPRKWSQREIDIAFLVKAHGGPRLLYALQKAEGYPSRRTLHRQKIIPELKISIGVPSEDEMKANIIAFLGELGRKPPIFPEIGQILMIDGVALEEACRYDHSRLSVVGLCREHSNNIDHKVMTLRDIERLEKALHDDHVCHHGKDGTVVGLAPVTGTENYFTSPLILSPSCKSEKGKDLAQWVTCFLKIYKDHPCGRARHGPIRSLGTDGEPTLQNLRFSEFLVQDLDPLSPLGQLLYRLTGLNCRTGIDGVRGTCDPKHGFKRCATMFRSSTGIQVGDTVIQPEHIMQSLLYLDHMTAHKADILLYPADKQNVPNAVRLLQELYDLSGIKVVPHPGHLKHLRAIAFIAKVLSYFLFPFIKVEMSLSEQIQSLSAYSHLLTGLYTKHRLGFMTSALFADTQAIVKNVIFTTAELQLLKNPEIEYYILFEGTDRLEGVFSHARTQDHARNFDILQLAHKLSIGAEINAIYERYPDLDRGHKRRQLFNARGVDHINPRSWIGDVHVNNVDIEKEYFAGRKVANDLLVRFFGNADAAIDFDELFRNPMHDHLRPQGVYIGSRLANEEEVGGTDYFGPFLDIPDLDCEPLTCEADNETILNCDEDRHGTVDPPMLRSSTGQLESDPSIEIHDPDALLNPTPDSNLNSESNEPRKHYIEINGDLTHVALAIGHYLGSKPQDQRLHSRVGKVTSRPLRARGVTIDQLLKPAPKDINKHTDEEDKTGKVKSGDPGAILVRVGETICLGVVEILGFVQGPGTSQIAMIDLENLEKIGNSNSVSVAVQVMELVPQSTDSNSWIWNHKYIQIEESLEIHGGATTQRHFTTRVPGPLLIPLGPKLAKTKVKECIVPVWVFCNQALQE